MSRVRPLSLAASLLFVTAVPFVWARLRWRASLRRPLPTRARMATEQRPSPRRLGSAAESSSAAPVRRAIRRAPALAAADTSAAAPATPAAPPMSGTDCGKCIEKTCAKQAAACGKNTDCQVDARLRSTAAVPTRAPAACLDAASAADGREAEEARHARTRRARRRRRPARLARPSASRRHSSALGPDRAWARLSHASACAVFPARLTCDLVARASCRGAPGRAASAA